VSYASDDPATRLAAVREAIQRVLNGQEYEIQDRRLRRASLRDLQALETSLIAQVNVAAVSGGGGFTLAQIDPPI
jgi:ribosomal protein L20